MENKAKEIKMVSVSEIKPRPGNRNKHPQDQIDHLVKIYQYQGFRRPLIVSNLSGLLVCGHGRLIAAKQAGFKELPVIFQDYDSEDQEYADHVADNAIGIQADLDLKGINEDLMNLGPDFDIDWLGIKNFTLDPADKEDPNEDDVSGDAPAVARLGDIYQLGAHRLMCGDSTSQQAVLKLLDGEKIDMVFTDPPYGIEEEGDRSSRGGITRGNKLKSFIDDSISYAVDAFKICQELDPKTQVWWGANYYCHALPQTGNWLVWDKRLEDKQRDMNSDAELAWVENGRNSVRIFRHLWKGLIKGSEHGEKRVHPTQKPVALAVWCFKEYGNPKTVLDLFGGSGSTMIACEKSQRKCFTMELDPHYCDVIISRWEQYTGKEAELIERIDD